MKILTSLFLTAFFAVHPGIKRQSTIEQLARELLANFNAGRFEAASRDFNDDLRPQVTPAVLEQVRNEVTASVGAFQSVSAVHHLAEEGYRAIEIVAQYEKSQVSVRVVFDTRDRISTVHINPILPPAVELALEKIAREFLADLLAGRFTEAAKAFDPTMRAQLTPSNLADLNSKVLTVFGTVKSITEVRERLEPPYRIVEVIAVCEKSPLALRVAFDGQNRVAAVHISPNVKQQ